MPPSTPSVQPPPIDIVDQSTTPPPIQDVPGLAEQVTDPTPTQSQPLDTPSPTQIYSAPTEPLAPTADFTIPAPPSDFLVPQAAPAEDTSQPSFGAPPSFVPQETSPAPTFSPPTPTPSPAAATPPVKSSPFKWVAGFFIGAVLLGLIFFLVTKVVLPLFNPSSSETNKSATKQTTITYQGLWEPAEVMRVVLDEFEKQNPDIKVNYTMQSHVDYRERLQTSLSQKVTPDVVRFHSTWLPMLMSSLQVAPAGTITTTEIQSNFHQAVSDAVVVGGQVYAAPTTFEGLALFTNESMFATAGLQPPTTWEDLHTSAKLLTQMDPQTKAITQAGVALGTTNNVDHWPDIVSLMALQAGGNLKQPEAKVGEALSYYSGFANAESVYYSWNSTLPSSVQAFAAGKVAMIFAPSWRALEIKTINPSLSWKIYPVPQLPETPTVTWANFWVEGVPKNAANSTQAWKLVKFLASSQAQQLLYNAATQQRGYAQSPANKALATTLADNPIIGPYLQQSQYAKTFFTTSLTHDGATGINSRLIKYLEDAINSLNQGRQVDQVLPTLQQGFQQVLSQYGLVAATAPTGSVQP